MTMTFTLEGKPFVTAIHTRSSNTLMKGAEGGRVNKSSRSYGDKFITRYRNIEQGRNSPLLTIVCLTRA